MRVSACGWAGRTLDEVKAMSRAVTEVTHNHPEGIKGAEATAVATFLARTGKSMEEIRAVVVRDYYPLDFTLDEIRPTYEFDVSCQGSVPQALEAFFESKSFEDANAWFPLILETAFVTFTTMHSENAPRLNALFFRRTWKRSARVPFTDAPPRMNCLFPPH